MRFGRRAVRSHNEGVAPRVTLYPLDESGNRRAAIPISQSNGRALLQLGPQHRTLWYEAVVR